MSQLSDPKKLINRLFKMEIAEKTDSFCQLYEKGTTLDCLPLAQGELVYGVYKEKYYFSELALYVREKENVRRIPWRQITGCSTEHGDGKKVSKLNLLSGQEINVRVGDMAVGWSGRVSQLFHQMIKKYATGTFEFKTLGPPHLQALTCDLSETERAILPEPSSSNNTWRKSIKCSCGEVRFEIRYLGELADHLICDQDEQMQRIEAVCKSCARVIEIFDSYRHGYNAVICYEGEAEPQGRKVDNEYSCNCGSYTFSLAVEADYDTPLEELPAEDRSKYDSSYSWVRCVSSVFRVRNSTQGGRL